VSEGIEVLDLAATAKSRDYPNYGKACGEASCGVAERGASSFAGQASGSPSGKQGEGDPLRTLYKHVYGGDVQETQQCQHACAGGRVLDPELALAIIDVWLT
jgi:hypothetical protein